MLQKILIAIQSLLKDTDHATLMRMKVGTLPWLLRHELRLWWREISTKPAVVIATTILSLLFTSLFVSLWFSLGDVRQEVVFGTIPDLAIWLAVGVWLLGFCYALTMAMGYSLVALFERGDLDLLVSSPVSSKVIFASRFVAIAYARSRQLGTSLGY
ncbi:MAG: hypothetical protein PUP92_01540 [Rhizonema sp. PD38]|nr:hypothetical protein [Rhizonema sp. PD38]